MQRDDVILVRGGGDLATGSIHRLWSAGLKVLVLEAEHPAAIRRQVSVSEAVYEGGAVVEGMRAALVKTLDEATGFGGAWRCAGDGGTQRSRPAGAGSPRSSDAISQRKSRNDAGYGSDDHRARPGFYRRCKTISCGIMRPPSGHIIRRARPLQHGVPESSAAMVLSVSSTQKRPVSSGMCVPSEILCRRVKRSRKSKRRTASALR